MRVGGRGEGVENINIMCLLKAGTLLIQRLTHQTVDERGRSKQLMLVACAQHEEEVRRVYYPIVRCICINYQYYSEARVQPRDEAK